MSPSNHENLEKKKRKIRRLGFHDLDYTHEQHESAAATRNHVWCQPMIGLKLNVLFTNAVLPCWCHGDVETWWKQKTARCYVGFFRGGAWCSGHGIEQQVIDVQNNAQGHCVQNEFSYTYRVNQKISADLSPSAGTSSGKPLNWSWIPWSVG